ncbi:hypothetical protein PENSTE_c016G06751 [Penicillium steckii]|uniref:Uncharacterized protein n=1 Tax=Penicillium steckii TaxID=303698 RepID=A0A1V6SYN0_9EURO|nr:hypothetical protein PENSTE_c016G06751 [Penicillium steckii]
MSGYRYGNFQRSGRQRRKWIQNPNDRSCPIPPSYLTIQDLLAEYQVEFPPPSRLPASISYQAVELGLPECAYRTWYMMENDFEWQGSACDTLITLDNIRREPQSDAPYISDITLALFRSCFRLNHLRHIFVTSIVERETSDFVISHLYRAYRFQWPVSRHDVNLADTVTWEYGTPEYDALLGTRIGKIVAYIIIGGFQRGSVRIARIVTWPGWMMGARLNMRFDIE